MKTLRYIIGVIGLCTIISFMACVEKFEAYVSDVAMKGLVIEGNIMSDSTVVFTLSKILPLTETEENKELFDDYLVSEAELSVKGSDGSSWQGHLLRSGEYQVKVGILDPGVEYFLEVLYDGDTYQSTPRKPLLCSGIEKMTFSQPDSLAPVTVCLDSKEVDLSETKYYMWYFEEDWEVRTPYVTTALYDPDQKRIVNYAIPPVAQGWCHYGTDEVMLGATASTVENRIVGKPIRTIRHTDSRLSVLYSIRVQQRNLTRLEYEYYQVRVKLNNEMGGLFTPQPTELPTNITCSNPDCRVIGFVGCNMGVAYNQMYISRDEVFYVDENECGEGEAPEGSSEEKYSAGFQIGSVTEMGTELLYEWVRRRCADVRYLGADPVGRPSWWPNPYIFH